MRCCVFICSCTTINPRLPICFILCCHQSPALSRLMLSLLYLVRFRICFLLDYIFNTFCFPYHLTLIWSSSSSTLHHGVVSSQLSRSVLCCLISCCFIYHIMSNTPMPQSVALSIVAVTRSMVCPIMCCLTQRLSDNFRCRILLRFPSSMPLSQSGPD